VDIILKTRNCDVPARLKEDARERVTHATRIYDRLLGVEMVFSEEPNPRIAAPATVEVTARTKGHHIRAEGAGEDHRGALDMALGKFEGQLRRYKTRVVDRRRGRGRGVPAANGHVAGVPAAQDAAAELTPSAPIVRTKTFELTAMVPEDAAMQLELLGHEFYLFRNAASGACSVVYRRKDGNFGLIEAGE
jgi:putative sigma-54 modulation protein